MSPTEVELKLAIDADSLAAFRRDAALASPLQHGAGKLDNTYFDTPDLRLARKEVGLRVRKRGRQLLQTVKCTGTVSAGLSTRAEWEHPFAGYFDFSQVTDTALQRLLESRREQLVPVFSTQFRREYWVVQPAPGCEIEVALDRGEIVAGDARTPITEVELELRSGTRAQLLAFARDLATRVPLVPDDRSKAERGYALFRGAPLDSPRRARGVTADHADTPVSAFCRIAWECLDQIAANMRGACTNDDPEYAHQLRIGVRRLRSALRLFRSVLPPEFVELSQARLKDLARLPAHTREWDVLLQEIIEPAAAHAPDYDGLAALIARATARRDAERDTMRAHLRTSLPGSILLSLMATVDELTDTQGETEQPDLAAFAAWRVSRLGKRAATAAKAARNGEPAQLHALRLALKRLRYTLEFVSPRVRARHSVSPRDYAELQASLGVLNDLYASGPLLESIAAGHPELVPAIALIGGHHLAAWRERADGELLRSIPWRKLARGWVPRT